MEDKCVCGRELKAGRSLCYVCETLLLLSPEQQAEYLKIKEECENDKTCNSKQDKRRFDHKGQ
jgi:hypothetical protein